MPNQSNNPQNRTEEERNRIGEEELQFQRERAAENSGTSNGLMIGGLLALAGIGAAMAYYLSRPAPTPTTIINTPPNPTAVVSPPPQKQTTIIDRTVEKAAPPQVKVVEVEKPVLVPVPSKPKVVEVPKTVIVPGPTKIIEVEKPVAAPATPATTDKSEPAKPSFNPSAAPSPTVSDSEPVNVPSPGNTNTGNN
ncbi:hypothetical protein [Chamaesiphon sp.]|uniref:hypothetical protein n=1 Tax=Chamaesiphon sp. TaxID=2814140 RepID=UPI0035939221